ncbi:OmpH family outer membrane protein [Hymenobacter negativus]|uniref:OmpH family outer membrane protein n=1 Tax=Hymenobacter negativus TaxID=2795026 RepID=A0ABS3QET9_9BACT|nr:OmpH family outer membrane protein [Hymenobacter negativus]MBO2009606.1 OmpH family outer membrane protein [Hymenobacter negativus]
MIIANKIYTYLVYMIFFLAIFATTSCNCNFPMVYVNPNKILQGYHGSAIQHEILATKVKIMQQRVDSLDTELQALNTASAATRARKEQQLLRYRDAVQQQAQQENQRVTQAVLNEINAYIKQYGKEKGYTFILGATDSGNIVYAAEGTDVSEEVLKELNAQYDRQHSTAPR